MDSSDAIRRALRVNAAQADLILTYLNASHSIEEFLGYSDQNVELDCLKSLVCSHLAGIFADCSLKHGIKQLLLHGALYDNDVVRNSPMKAIVDDFYRKEETVFSAVKHALATRSFTCGVQSDLSSLAINVPDVHSTSFLMPYNAIDSRVGQLIIAIEHWSRCRGISSSEHSEINPFFWKVLALRFLQRTTPPVIPPDIVTVETWKEQLGDTKPNQDGIFLLLVKFFICYSVSIRTNFNANPRNSIDTDLLFLPPNIFHNVTASSSSSPELTASGSGWCIEDPTDRSVDLGISFINHHGLVLVLTELRRAVLISSTGDLADFYNELCRTGTDEPVVNVDTSRTYLNVAMRGKTSLHQPSHSTSTPHKAMKNRKEFLADVLSWHCEEILNSELLSSRLLRIPDTFTNSELWYSTFYPHIVEEMRANLQKNLEKKLNECNFCSVNLRTGGSFRSDTFSGIKLVLPHKLDGKLVADEYSNSLAILVYDSVTELSLSILKQTKHHLVKLEFPDHLGKLPIADEVESNDGDGFTVFNAIMTMKSALIHSESNTENLSLLLLGVHVTAPERTCDALARMEDPLCIMANVTSASFIDQYYTSCLPVSVTERFDKSIFQKLNRSQKEAVLKVLETSLAEGDEKAYFSPIQLIKGPPGTGKTATLVSLLHCLIDGGLRVHVTAPTNIAVCELAKRVLSSCILLSEGRIRLSDILLIGTKKRLDLHDGSTKALHGIFLDSRVERIRDAIDFIRIYVPFFERSARIRENCFPIELDPDSCTEHPTHVFYDAMVGFANRLQSYVDVLFNEAPIIYHYFSELDGSELQQSIQVIKECTYDQFKAWLSTSAEVSSELKLYKAINIAVFTLIKVRISAIPELHVVRNEVAHSAKIVFSTVNVGGRSIFLNLHFDVVIVDEATQLVQAETAIVLRRNLKCIVLAGDDKQLPSTVLSKNNQKLKFGESLFERLVRLNYPLSLLNVQYRMHSSISRWPNMKFYEGKLIDADHVLSNCYSKDWHQHFSPLHVIDVNFGQDEIDRNGSSFNEIEADVVRKLTLKIRKLVSNSLTIGIITPYSAQVGLLAHLKMDFTAEDGMRSVTYVSTVDGFQGQECDIIIFSAVRSNRTRKLGFLRDERRLNVALTRAKFCLIVVCNVSTMECNPTWKHFLDHARVHGMVNMPSTDPIVNTARIKWLKQENQLKTLQTVMDSQVFEKSSWKVLFANEFRKAMNRNSSIPAQKLMKVVLNLSHGHWPKREHRIAGVAQIYADIIHSYNFNGWCLVWSVDVDKPSNTQCIRLWDVVLPTVVMNAAKKVEKRLAFYSDQYIKMCSHKDRNNHLECHPTTFEFESNFRWTKLFSTISSEAAVGVSSREEESISGIDVETFRHDSTVASAKFFSLSSEIARLLLRQVDDGSIELPFEMSKLEDEIVRYRGSAFVLGRSGTGKTTVILHRMYLQSKMNCPEGMVLSAQRQLMITTSPILCDSIRKDYDSMCRTDKFILSANTKSVSDSTSCCVGEYTDKYDENFYPAALSECKDEHFPIIVTYSVLLRMIDCDLSTRFFLDNKIYREVTHARFCSDYAPRLTAKSMIVDASMLFKEIMSHIKGSVQALYEEKGCLSEEQYVGLANLRQSELTCDQRKVIYALFIKYEKIKSKEYIGDYDQLDLIFHVHRSLRQCNISEKSQMLNVYVDEVQDLVPAQIALLKFLCKNPGGYLFAGDTAQTIAHGVSFRFETVKDIFYHEIHPEGEHVVIPKIWHLTENFRTHTGVVNIANSVVKLILSFFPLSIDKLEPETSSVSGPLPVFLAHVGENLFDSLFQSTGTEICEFGAEQVILVRDEECKQEVKNIIGNKALVLTALEAKGMEFTDCLLYNFFDSSPLGTAWRVLFRDIDPTQPHPKFLSHKHSLLCNELKQLYVLLTRARQNLIIYDSNREVIAPLLQFWKQQDLVRLKSLDEDIRCVFLSFSSQDEWLAKGKQFFERAQFSNAKLCYQRADNELLVNVCVASEMEQDANNCRVRSPTDASKLYLSAARLFSDLGGYSLHAARCYEMGGEFEIAANLYKKVGKLVEAASCLEQSKKWVEAALLHEQLFDLENALKCCYRLPDFDLALKILDGFLHLMKVSVFEHKDNQQACVMKALLHFHSTNKSDEMKRFVDLLPNLLAKRTFLKRYNYLELLLNIEVEGKCYAEAAILCEDLGDLFNAASYYDSAGESIESVRCSISHLLVKYCDENFNRLPLSRDDQIHLAKAQSILQSIPSDSSSKEAPTYALLLEYLTLSSPQNLIDSEGLRKLQELSVSTKLPKEEQIYIDLLINRTIIQCVQLPLSFESTAGSSLQSKKRAMKSSGAKQTIREKPALLYDNLCILRDSVKHLHRLLGVVSSAFAGINCLDNSKLLLSQSNWTVVRQILRFFNFAIKSKSIINVRSSSMVHPIRAKSSPVNWSTSLTLLEFSQKIVQLLVREVTDAATLCIDQISLIKSKTIKAGVMDLVKKLNRCELSQNETFKFCLLQYDLYEMEIIAQQASAIAGIPITSESKMRISKCLRELTECVLPAVSTITECAEELHTIRISRQPKFLSLVRIHVSSEFFQAGMHQDKFCRALLYAELLGEVSSSVKNLLEMTYSEEEKYHQSIREYGNELRFVNKFQKDLAREYLWQYSPDDYSVWEVGSFFRSIYCTADILKNYMRYSLKEMFELPKHCPPWMRKRSFVSPFTLVKLLEKNVVWLMLHWKRCSGIILLDSLSRDVLCRDDVSYFDAVTRFSQRSKEDWTSSVTQTASNQLFTLMRYLMFFLKELTRDKFDLWISWNNSDLASHTVKSVFYIHIVRLVMLYVVNQNISKTKIIFCTELAQLLQSKTNAIHDAPPCILSIIKGFDHRSAFQQMKEIGHLLGDPLLLLGVQNCMPFHQISRTLNPTTMVLQAVDGSVVKIVPLTQQVFDSVISDVETPEELSTETSGPTFSADDDRQPPPSHDSSTNQDKFSFFHKRLVIRLHEARTRLTRASNAEILGRFFEKEFLLAEVSYRMRHAAQQYSKVLSPLVIELREWLQKFETYVLSINPQKTVDLEALDTAKDAAEILQAHVDAIVEKLRNRVRLVEDMNAHITDLAGAAREDLNRIQSHPKYRTLLSQLN